MFKVCTSCNVSLSVSRFLIKSQTGLPAPVCQECANVKSRAVRLAIKNGERPPKITTEFKTELFIKKAVAKHKNTYSYDRVSYTDKLTEVEIFCTKHNDYFLQSPAKHLQGTGCTACGNKQAGLKRMITKSEFLIASVEAHGEGKYDYSLVEYKCATTPVDIGCNRHGSVFQQTPSAHMSGKTGCVLCYKSARATTVAKTAAEKHVEGHWHCTTCDEVLPVANFVFRKGGEGKLYSKCRGCRARRSITERDVIRNCPVLTRKKKDYAAEYTRLNSAAANVKSAKRRVRKMNCTPKWIDTDYESLFMIEIHSLAVLREVRSGFKWHVDHVIPLTSDTVCGLHCSDNLQLIPAAENLAKGNYYWPDMP